MNIRQILEDLNQVGQEPDTPASKQAKKLGLAYVGFGRYMDPESQQVTHLVQDGKLTPFNRAVRTNSFLAHGQDDTGLLGAITQPENDELHNILLKHYSAAKYDDRELDAIHHFTDLGHIDINRRLGLLPADIHPKKIERQAPDDPLPDIIGSLDSAVKRGRAPQDFITYSKLHDDMDLKALKPGSEFKFKGFRNTSISLPTVLNSSDKTKLGSGGRPVVSLLQMNIKKHTRGLYASDYSPTPDDREFILPRGAHVRIVDGPKMLVGSDGPSGIMNLQIQYYNAEVKA